jgi:hypothetical protein
MEGYDSYESQISNSAVSEENNNLHMMLMKNRLSLNQFIIDTEKPTNGLDVSEYITIYESFIDKKTIKKSKGNHCWQLKFAWTKTYISFKFILNGREAFKTCTISTCRNQLYETYLAMTWTDTFKEPKTLHEYDVLIWIGQIFISCLRDFFGTKFTEDEKDVLTNTFRDIGKIKGINKSITIHDTECFKFGSGVKKRGIVRQFYKSIGFRYRRIADDLYFDFKED